MDATELTFGDNNFDLVIDKGTYDALSVIKKLTFSAQMIKII